VFQKDTLIHDILESLPEAEEIFQRYSLPCADCVVAQHETLEEGARLTGVSLEALLAELNEALSMSERSAKKEPAKGEPAAGEPAEEESAAGEPVKEKSGKEEPAKGEPNHKAKEADH
jgi:hybrid cluster-associated redox disulfide protein